jgi:23S rRNA pseudouridine2605 synthase
MERLHKFLAHAGVGSRRDCEDLIRQGRVSVDGEVVREMGAVVDPARQRVKVDGVPVKSRPPVHFLVNKPAGFLCTTAEGERGRRAIDLVPRRVPGLHTVGRLDKESEGLVILTTDGALTEKLTHPRFEVPKVYRVLAAGRIGREEIEKLLRGVWLAEGKARASTVHVRRVSHTATLLDIELREGMNREIRRMLARLGHKVKKLTRTGIGPLRIEGLPVGGARPLSQAEVDALVRAAEAPPEPAPLRRKPATRDAPAGRPGPRGAGGAERGPVEAAEGRLAPKGMTGPGAPSLPRERGPARDAAQPRDRAAAVRAPARAVPPPPARYEPDEEGVIVIRRPPVRFSEEE